ncbi:MAG: aminopeptidase P family protein [Actinobacteria bacterium]|nr:aminopeptidase P family protein [Actinomycetota bacterium]
MMLTEQLSAARLQTVRAQLEDHNIDALCISVGADLPYLIGYEAMPLERLTMLVVDQTNKPTLFIPTLEVPRVETMDGVFDVVGWDETIDPIGLVGRRIGDGRRVAMGDTTWARFVIDLLKLRPELELHRSAGIMTPLRAVKSSAEIEALRTAAEAADRVIGQLQNGEVGLVGRTEAQVSDELGHRLLAEGHQVVNFAIVASGPNSASPHHHAGSRVIEPGDVVLCDIGGTFDGYCSDITRCVFAGEPSAEVEEVYAVLYQAQRAAVAIGHEGASCQDVDRAARSIIAEAGYGDQFVHRTGHGIGMEAHEDPYMVEGNADKLVAGHAFSVEPGIYLPGRFGLRLEDIVVAGVDAPDQLNQSDHDMLVVTA